MSGEKPSSPTLGGTQRKLAPSPLPCPQEYTDEGDSYNGRTDNDLKVCQEGKRELNYTMQ